MKFELVTPENLVLECDVSYINIPGTEGAFGVMPGHSPLVSALQAGGTLEVTDLEGTTRNYTVTGGFAEVNAESTTVLAEGLTEIN